MASLPSLLIFPSWCLTNVASHDEFSTTITPSLGGEASSKNWSESRFVIDLSGGTCTDEQRREIKWLNRAVYGRAVKFLYRRYKDDEWELNGKDGNGEYLGDGDGVRTVFQARIYDENQGVATSKPVYFLDHDIEPLGTTSYGQPATETRLAEVRVNGVLQELGVDYTVVREGGRIVFTVAPAAGARVTLKCGFFAIVRLNQEYIKTEPASAGWWRVSDGVSLIEPKGATRPYMLEAA